MGDRVKRSIRLRTERKALDGGRPIAEPVHLPTGQHQTRRALQRQRTQHRQHHLILRSQPCTEPTANERRDNAHIVRFLGEHAAQIALYVLHALGLVIDRELAAAVPPHRGGKQFHRIVMLGGNEIFGFMTHLGCRIGFRGIAVRFVGLLDDKRLIAPPMQIGDEGLLFVFDVHQRGSVARDLPFLGQHQRDRLAAEHDLVVVERTERRTFFWRDIVLPGLVGAGHAGPVLMGEHVEHAFDTQRLAGVDARDAALRNGRLDHAAISKAGNAGFAGISGLAGDFGATVYA